MSPQKVNVAAVLETPETKARIAIYEKIAAQEQASLEVTAKLFSPAELMHRAKEI